MKSEQFVEVLRRVVRDQTVRDLPETLEHPPGRAPRKELLELSAWYRGLGESDRAMVRRIVAESVDATMFALLCVLDGAQVIEDPKERGELVLEHVGPRGRTRLNDETTPLHELW